MASRLLSLCVIVIAQILTLTSAQSSSSTASAIRSTQTYTITVGKGDHKFNPEVTQAEIGDIIEFQFFPPNHSVVRAEYQYPCIPYEMTGRGKVGFFSGFKPVDAILSDPPKWQVRINDTNPIFFYCSAIGSCINYGMVGVINPNASTSLENQRQLAKDSAYMLNPGQAFPSEGSPSGLPQSTASSTSTPTTMSTSVSSAAAATSTSAAPISNGTVLAAGAIAGIAVGCAVVLALAAGLFYFCGRARTLKQEVDRVSSLPPHTPASMFQNHSLLGAGKGRSTKMTDSSSRHSGTMSPVQVPYDAWNMPRQEMSHGKADYVVDVAETTYLRDPYGNPNNRAPSDIGGTGSNAGWSNQSASSGVPQRQQSILLNPQGPMELHSPDPRRENF